MNTIIGIVFISKSFEQLETMPTELVALANSPDVLRNLTLLKAAIKKLNPKELLVFDEADFDVLNNSLE